ncbi:MAG: DUF1553 domain-containing protein [Armatimonadetes bacterium]|nr:DUF1553 domain-containing protein [Armatimonadota bacterium]
MTTLWRASGWCLVLCLAVCEGGHAAPAVAEPFEVAEWPVKANAVDGPVFALLQERGIQPANPCSDSVFIRRVYLDLIGTLPLPDDWLAFYESKDPDKRAKLVDSLVERPEFAEYQALKWGDLLRVKSEFPINLWPNADQFVRELLTSSGSNFRVAPVNFYRAMQGHDPAGIADTVGLTLMGTRLSGWPADQRADLANIFSRVLYKKTTEWKEEIVCLNPAPAGPLAVKFPDGKCVTIPPDVDPRGAFADWLIRPDNPWFARNLVNRMWSWMMGRGVIHEPDDIRPDNPPANPDLLKVLEHELVAHKWDMRSVFRLICNSRAYQQSSIPRSADPAAPALFAMYGTRRLDAEVLSDIIYWMTGGKDSYSSNIPEPFTWVPEDQRTITLFDGSITSPFLEMFGRPPRDSGFESERSTQPTDDQRLYLLNSSEVQRRLERGGRVLGCVEWAKGDVTQLTAALYVNVLTRRPTPAETEVALGYFKTSGLGQVGGAVDLSWALINSKEVPYRH